MAQTITICRGDGIGPEIIDATLDILKAANAQLNYEEIEVGENVYRQGFTSGIKPDAWQVLQKNGVFLKAPITTPQGGGVKSLNVTIRKTMGMFANVRPCISYAPIIKTHHPNMDVVIVRENEEDTYAGIEHRQTREVTQCLKLITRPGTERVVHYAFDYAVRHRRKRVTCLIKDNIMKITDGLFKQVFYEVAKHYPDIAADHMIIDIGTAKLAYQPEAFDVIVTPNLYGDIISDVAAQITGSVGLGPSANIGQTCTMFEAIHGSAPDIAGQGIANPSGILLAAVLMLNHIHQHEPAQAIHNAWLKTLEDGIHTADLVNEVTTKKRASTSDFAAAVIDHLGQEPTTLRPVRYYATEEEKHPRSWASPPPEEKQLVGVDIFIDWDQDPRDPEVLGPSLEAAAAPAALKLKMITNRGVKVYPQGLPETFCTDHWRCRFVAKDDQTRPVGTDVVKLQQVLVEKGFDVIKTENLYQFDGRPGYSLGQGE